MTNLRQIYRIGSKPDQKTLKSLNLPCGNLGLCMQNFRIFQASFNCSSTPTSKGVIRYTVCPRSCPFNVMSRTEKWARRIQTLKRTGGHYIYSVPGSVSAIKTNVPFFLIWTYKKNKIKPIHLGHSVRIQPLRKNQTRFQKL